ncbi:hypothetical protein Csa_017515 [Cucumis sativus]|nr:hypothetical protein Csa_017515 [Cucumis sativus]
MGCGISRFDPKEVVEATANDSNHNDTPNHSNHKSYSTSNCFTGESKHMSHQGRPPPPEPRHSSSDRAAPGDQKMMKMKTNVKQEESRGINTNGLKIRMRMRTRTRTSTQIDNDDDDSSDEDSDKNDQNCREICRGGSPSFREYCVDSESRSRSMGSEGRDQTSENYYRR